MKKPPRVRDNNGALQVKLRLDALRGLSEEKKQARVTHAYRVVKRFGLPIRTRAEVDRFLAWMQEEGLAASI